MKKAAVFLLAAVFASSHGWGKTVKRDNIVKTAQKYIGVKYVRGASSASGFDCSGFVMFVYGKCGIKLPRTSEEQFKAGKAVDLKNALPGDIVCFKINGKRVSHVGIYLGGMKFIHAPSSGKSVRESSINEIYWKKRFFAAVRIPGVN